MGRNARSGTEAPEGNARSGTNVVSIYTAILFKVLSTACFAVMGACARWLGEVFPVGQVVFFRSFVAFVPVLIFYAWRREIWTAMNTSRPFGHVARGLIGVVSMFFLFAALARLPIADVTAITFSTPLIIVALAGLLLGERVRGYRWSAVVLGLLGVLVILAPHLSVSELAAMSGSATSHTCVGGLSTSRLRVSPSWRSRQITNSPAPMTIAEPAQTLGPGTSPKAM